MARAGPAAFVMPLRNPLTNPSGRASFFSSNGEILNSKRSQVDTTKTRTITPRQKFSTQSGKVTRTLVPKKTPISVVRANHPKRRITAKGNPPRKTCNIHDDVGDDEYSDGDANI